ncbi:MAG: DUF4783 domain-containing protein [Sphingobacterium composti]|uniref:DUF4783 domain-containing protein n=1 Tax=Sphingobacterium composti TaxID=363260 RepID=UPI00135C3530|nr:DUF4783 domain-containing protein [Sphingobacterium composti Ten et al. 2007 non Yoo et al. 2007]
MFSLFNVSDSGEIDKSVLTALEKGDAKELSKFFTSSIKISIHKNDQIATKYQSELILDHYFKENKLQDIKKSSLANNSHGNYLIYDVKTQNKSVRVFVKIVKLKNSEYISELRIE